jgi:hypothetical protein
MAGIQTHRLLQYAAVTLAAVALWLIFYPALMSADSLEQYRQATAGRFNDWHPPIMSIVLMGVLKMGADIQFLTLLQSLAGLFGFRAALCQLSGAKFPLQTWLCSLAPIAFLAPVTPLAFYLMTFWKDTWVAILFLWLAAYLSWLYRTGEHSAWRIAGGAALAALVFLARHNAFVILPAVGLWIALSSRRYALALLPFLFAGLFHFSLYAFFPIERSHIDSVVKAGDLVGICVLDQNACETLPYTRAYLRENFQTQYQFGRVDPIWLTFEVARPGYVREKEANPELDSEYRRAIRDFPLLFARVKLLAFYRLFTLGDSTYYWSHRGIDSNPWGLRLSEKTRPLWGRMLLASTYVGNHRLLHWLSGQHLPWFALNVVLLALAAAKKQWITGSLLLIPLFYYLSYIAAVLAWDFRYLYPATLFIQMFCLSRLIRGAPTAYFQLHRRLSKIRPVAPNESVPQGLKNDKTSPIERDSLHF